ncbi:hypothetical protein BDZ45DRAFT_673708 [Acephala macrosclerotiorum]|nr:hypothetical protein BDZ45DRAFT_673708 [Acephala macrosclerotiorum]
MSSPDPVNVTYYIYENEYHYSPQHLLESYGIATLFTTFAIIVGPLSLRSNGVSHSTSFSAILSTTRNLQVDELVLREGHDIGSEPLTEAMMKARLGFGTLLNANAENMELKHFGFGFKLQVQALKRGEMI